MTPPRAYATDERAKLTYDAYEDPIFHEKGLETWAGLIYRGPYRLC